MILVFSPNVCNIAANDVRAALSTTNAARKVAYLFTLLSRRLFDAMMELQSGVYPRKSWLSANLTAQRR